MQSCFTWITYGFFFLKSQPYCLVKKHTVEIWTICRGRNYCDYLFFKSSGFVYIATYELMIQIPIKIWIYASMEIVLGALKLPRFLLNAKRTAKDTNLVTSWIAKRFVFINLAYETFILNLQHISDEILAEICSAGPKQVLTSLFTRKGLNKFQSSLDVHRNSSNEFIVTKCGIFLMVYTVCVSESIKKFII